MTAHYIEDKTSMAIEYGYSDYESALIDLYLSQKLSLRQIGEMFGSTYQAVLYQLRKHGIERRSRGGNNNVRRGR